MTGLSLLSSKFKVLSSLQSQLLLSLALLTFQSNHNLTCGLGLLVEDGLGLSPESHLLRIITTLSLGEVGSLTSLVLCNLVWLMLTAFFSSTESVAFLRNINHFELL